MSSKKNYKNTLAKVLDMRSASASAIYRRTKLLVEVFDDADFRADLGNADDLKAADALDKYVDDTPFNFLQLRAMLAEFPSSEAWGNLSLREIHAQTIERGRPVKETAAATRTRVSAKDLEEVRTQLNAAIAREKHTSEILQQTTKSYQELADENAELRRENAELRGRITELERMLDRKLAAA